MRNWTHEALHPLPLELRSEWMLHTVALERLHMSRSAFHRKRKLGLFECRRWGNRVIVKKSDIDRFLKHLKPA